MSKATGNNTTLGRKSSQKTDPNSNTIKKYRPSTGVNNVSDDEDDDVFDKIQS